MLISPESDEETVEKYIASGKTSIGGSIPAICSSSSASDVTAIINEEHKPHLLPSTSNKPMQTYGLVSTDYASSEEEIAQFTPEALSSSGDINADSLEHISSVGQLKKAISAYGS
ncbi:unnamed protein product [Protopolystoma xenopodis]|uniref:Uncharacterized protein n=1 Tax=Protopolystoma xenopodis TaxID=117903 RepID=A0A3S5AYX8_9PLAT|nr:unnamed protein product [Protopolystoma xenopodis]